MTETPSPAPDRKIRVALVFGGRSGEHAISAATAAGVMRAIDRDTYDVLPIGITREGEWVLTSGDPARWELGGERLPEVETSSGTEIATLSEAGPIDVVFPLLHGPYGEDGTIQGLLELAGVPYVGSGVLASAVGMDKHYMKIVFAGHGLPVSPYVVVKPADWENRPSEVVDRVQATLRFPVFVKPARGGSSLGVTRVEDLTGLAAAIDEARTHDPKVLVEQGVEGREIECAVLGGRDGAPPRASVPGEIIVDHDAATFYDFEAKYISAASARTQAPADLPADLAERVRELAVQAFEAIGAEGLSRVDVFVTPEGEVLINEINTMPGFTPISMYSTMWEASGLPYRDLVDELIRLALERPTGLR